MREKEKTNGRRLVNRLVVLPLSCLASTKETNLEAQERFLVLGRELRCTTGRGHGWRKRKSFLFSFFSLEPLKGLTKK